MLNLVTVLVANPQDAGHQQGSVATTDQKVRGSSPFGRASFDQRKRGRPAGICPNVAVSTAMWSAAVNEPALPGRSIAAIASPVLVHQLPNGWKPYPPL